MRLQLIGLAALALCAGHPLHARADGSFVAKTEVYADSDHTTVVSPLVAIAQDAWRGSTLSAHYLADVVSSASVDVVSNATKHMQDFRSEAGAGLLQRLGEWKLSGGYIYSIENDYRSHNIALGLSRDFFQHNTTVAIDWALSDDSIGRTGDSAFARKLLVNSASLRWSQTLGRRTIGQLSYTFTANDGYQASAYRFVPVRGGGAGDTLYKVPETVPKLRLRHALVAAVNQHLFGTAALQADYRFYIDDWGMTAHTLELRYVMTTHDVTIRIRERFHFQTGVDFYKPRYDTLEPYMTTDRESSRLWSSLTGVKLAWVVPRTKQRLELEAKGDFMYIGYVDYPLLAHRLGGDGELGLSMRY